MTEKGKNKNAILVLIILVIFLAAIGLVEYGIICKNIEKNRQLSTLKKQVEEEAKDGVKAVSYTHLDVYKRQAYRSIFVFPNMIEHHV